MLLLCANTHTILLSEHDQLFYLVYERIQVSRGSIFPHMWSFQSKITLEDLSQKVQEKSIQDGHPILHEFLQAVNLNYTVINWLLMIIVLAMSAYRKPIYELLNTFLTLFTYNAVSLMPLIFALIGAMLRK